MNQNGPRLPRGDFVKTSAAGLAAAVAAGPSFLARGATHEKPRKSIGIQVGAVSFVDKGTDQVL